MTSFKLFCAELEHLQAIKSKNPAYPLTTQLKNSAFVLNSHNEPFLDKEGHYILRIRLTNKHDIQDIETILMDYSIQVSVDRGKLLNPVKPPQSISDQEEEDPKKKIRANYEVLLNMIETCYSGSSVRDIYEEAKDEELQILFHNIPTLISIQNQIRTENQLTKLIQNQNKMELKLHTTNAYMEGIIKHANRTSIQVILILCLI